MSREVTLPVLGESVTEGTVSRWLKKVGDAVEADEPLVEISTDKVDSEVRSPAGGFLMEVRVHEDEVAKVGAVLALIGDADEMESVKPKKPAYDPFGLGIVPSSYVAPRASHDLPSTIDSTPYVTPLVRKLAEEAGVDLATVRGSGVGGRIRKQDILAAEKEAVKKPATPAAPPAPPAPPVSTPSKPPEPSVAAPSAKPAAPEKTSPSFFFTPEPSRPPEPTPEPVADKAKVVPEPELPTKPVKAGEDVAKVSKPAPVDLTPPKESVPPPAPPVTAPMVIATPAPAPTRIDSLAQTAATKPPSGGAPGLARPGPVLPPPVQPRVRAGAGRAGSVEKISPQVGADAREMVAFVQASAQLTATVEVDLTKVTRLRARIMDEFQDREGTPLTYLAFIAKATSEALQIYPKINARVDLDALEITYPSSEHIGFCVDTAQGLAFPVIRDASDLSVSGFARKIADLTARTHQDRLSPEELSGGTFTITDYGAGGTLFGTPMIKAPQVAILGTGAITRRSTVVADPGLGEIIVVRDMMYMSLTYDHRLIDGSEAARFLNSIKARLEEGDFGAEF